MDAASLRDALAGEVPNLLRYAGTLVREQATTEDLVQETLARALAHAASFRGEAALRTWLHRILHNLAVDQVRRNREHADSDLVGEEIEALWRDDTYTVDAATVVVHAEAREDLLDALSRLPTIYRSAVVLHDLEELTVAQIAEIQEINLPAAKQRLRRGRMMLVSILEDPERAARPTPEVPLRCWAARARVSDFLDDELSEHERLEVVRHLEGCPTCPPLYAGLVSTVAGVGALRDPDSVVPQALIERLLPTD